MRVPSLGARGEGWVWIQFAVMALVLVFRPYGLFTQVQPRKI